VHDLDVLAETVRATARIQRRWAKLQENIARERAERIETPSLTLGSTSLGISGARIADERPRGGSCGSAFADNRLGRRIRVFAKTAGEGRPRKEALQDLQRVKFAPVLRKRNWAR